MTEPTHWLDAEMFFDHAETAQQRWPVVRTGERQPIPDMVRLWIKMRDGFRCAWCGNTDELVLDHIVPWSAGGSDDPTNLRTLCWQCNEQRSNRRYVHADEPRTPLTRGCTSCAPPPESLWTDLFRAFCVHCRRPGRASRARHTRITAASYASPDAPARARAAYQAARRQETR